jgi:hypothetical protein
MWVYDDHGNKWSVPRTAFEGEGQPSFGYGGGVIVGGGLRRWRCFFGGKPCTKKRTPKKLSVGAEKVQWPWTGPHRHLKKHVGLFFALCFAAPSSFAFFSDV